MATDVLPAWAAPTPPRSPADGPDAAIDLLLAAIESAHGVTVTVHDRTRFLSNTDGTFLLPWTRYVHRSAFCAAGRTYDPATDRCIAHCMHAVNAVADRRQTPFVHHCWKGGSEIVVPVHLDGKLLFTLFAGVFRGDPRHRDPRLEPRLRALAEALPERPDSARLEDALRLAGASLIAWAESYRLAETPSNTRKRAVRDFIARHLDRDVALTDLARRLDLSPSRTSHVVQTLFERSFTELLLTARITRAQVMLATSDLPAARVAERCDFASPFHFSRLFRQRCGAPPGQWREMARKPAPNG